MDVALGQTTPFTITVKGAVHVSMCRPSRSGTRVCWSITGKERWVGALVVGLLCAAQQDSCTASLCGPATSNRRGQCRAVADELCAKL